MTQLELFQHESVGLLGNTRFEVNHDENAQLLTLTYCRDCESPVTVALQYSHGSELAELAKSGKLVTEVLNAVLNYKD